ncbi:MAG: GTPase HflX [Chitinophagales bacterium]|nr:GTPase HflX [Chitinophagales bacterium]
MKEYLDELSFLTTTAGAEPISIVYQKLDHPDTRTYIGSGKLQEVKKIIEAKDIDVVIFDDEISPSQQNNVEKELKIKVLDRSMLILDIFAQRAKTMQAKTQVELAQTQYLLPRLKGMWTHLDRIKGGVGMRGTGEKEIETDRRIAKDKISKLKNKLKEIDQQNLTQRKSRGEMVRVSLVGYTNVGKSTIMNLLSKADVFAENKLFATLDTTVRKVVINNIPFLLSDTVGFIRKLPHHLVESFKSTLDEVIESDVLLHVVDISHAQFEDQMNVVNKTLSDMKCQDKPIIVVFNKMDLYEEQYLDEYLLKKERTELINEMKNTWIAKTNDNCIFISATKGLKLDDFRETLIQKIKKLYLEKYPFKAKMVWGYED